MIEALDELMAKHKVDAILVYGDSTFGNPELRYVVGADLARGGIYVRQTKKEPILVVSNIDFGTASKSIVRDVRTYSEYGYEKLVAKHGRDQAGSLLFDRILKKHRVRGTVGLYGRNDASSVVCLERHLREMRHKIIGERYPSVLEVARETKSHLEIDKIRNVGDKTERVVKKTIEFLQSCEKDGNHLMYEKNKLTVGMVKVVARRYLAEENLTATEGLIIAVGPRSADPHYPGEDEDPIMIGQPIVFDIFPQEIGGYCYDMTRTFVLGKAPENIRKMYDSVSEAQRIAFDTIEKGCRAEKLMNAVCDHFSSDGFKTIRDMIKGDKEAEKMGFVHSLGHGVGLTIGEKPYLSLHSDDILKVGSVFTVEPGLYDPEVGGVRIEDVIALTDSGMVNLTSCEKTLEISV
jgi:Xaa-Pro aminopeptidase